MEKILRKNQLVIVGVGDDKYNYLTETNVNIARANFHTRSNFIILMTMSIAGGIAGIVFFFMGSKPDANKV